MNLDYTLESPEERKKLVEDILKDLEEKNITPTEAYLESLADYLIIGLEKQEKRQKGEKAEILTANRLVTINKREISFENLVSKFEGGEDGLYHLIKEDKNIIFQPKISITKKDLEEIQPLRQLREAITLWENRLKNVTGRAAYIAKRTLIELRKDQYVIKTAYQRPIVCTKLTHSSYSLPIEEKFEGIGSDQYPIFSGVSLTNPKVCEAILCNYSQLREDCWGNFESDIWFLLEDFDNYADKALREHPVFERIVECKVDGKSNAEIQAILKKEFDVNYDAVTISTIWRQKVPVLIASTAEDEWLQWYYTHIEQGSFKRCNGCGKIKLRHPKYFTRNNTSKDGLYSLCKDCRSKRGKIRREVINNG